MTNSHHGLIHSSLSHLELKMREIAEMKRFLRVAGMTDCELDYLLTSTTLAGVRQILAPYARWYCGYDNPFVIESQIEFWWELIEFDRRLEACNRTRRDRVRNTSHNFLTQTVGPMFGINAGADSFYSQRHLDIPEPLPPPLQSVEEGLRRAYQRLADINTSDITEGGWRASRLLASMSEQAISPTSKICSNCRFYCGSRHLSCAVNPCGPENNECSDFEEGEQLKQETSYLLSQGYLRSIAWRVDGIRPGPTREVVPAPESLRPNSISPPARVYEYLTGDGSSGRPSSMNQAMQELDRLAEELQQET